jgi:hypothetical protein
MTPRLRARVRRGAIADLLRAGWELDGDTQPLDDFVTVLWSKPTDPPWKPLGWRICGVRE